MSLGPIFVTLSRVAIDLAVLRLTLLGEPTNQKDRNSRARSNMGTNIIPSDQVVIVEIELRFKSSRINSESKNEDKRSASPNNDLTYSLSFLVFLQQSARQTMVPRAVPPWPLGKRALERREVLVTQLRKAAIKLAENSGRFAI